MKKLIAVIIFFSTPYLYSQTYSLSGKVLDQNKDPLPNVSLIFQEISVSTVTDDKGNYYFSILHVGEYHLKVNHPGYLSRLIKIDINADPTELDITLEKSLIETPVIDVTGTFNPEDISGTPYSVSSIEPRTLSRIRNENIASTISNLPGINNLSTGSSIGKPVIRGLTSQSVLIVHDGVKHDSQLWGDEHGPEISLFNIDRIEILRGPASIKYGADGIGGVVNIISKPLQFSANDKLLTYGDLELTGYSMNKEGAGNILFGLGTKNFGLKGFAGYRKSSTVKTPDGELMINSPDGERVITGGTLSNSADNEFQGGLSLGLNGKAGNITGLFETFNRELQLHEDPSEEPDVTPNQKIITDHFELKSTVHLSELLHLEPVLSYEHQTRKEFESIEDKNNNTDALHLDLKVFRGDVRLHHSLARDIDGSAGVSVVLNSNRSLAEEKLIPDYNGSGFGIYVLEKLERKKFTLSGGLRYDNNKLDIKESVMEETVTDEAVKIISPHVLTFNAFTGSAGAVYKPAEYLDIFANFGTGWRAPSEYELYVDGVHEGTGRFEKGLITLDSSYDPLPERSLNIDAGIRYRSKKFSGEISVYNNQINNFIYPSPTGLIDIESGLPLYDIKQDKSRFSGFEYSLQIHPLEWMLLTFSGDHVSTKNIATGNAIPFTPPSKNIIELKLQKSELAGIYNPYFLFGTKIVSASTQIDPLETETPGYSLFNAGIGCDVVLSKTIVSVDLSVTNLTDKKYTDHLSRYKYYAMNPGRSIDLKIFVPFRF